MVYKSKVKGEPHIMVYKSKVKGEPHIMVYKSKVNHIKKHERFIYELFIGSNADIVDKRSIHLSMKLLNSNC
jgi:hypothetical protein